jgi:hypothetical protein
LLLGAEDGIAEGAGPVAVGTDDGCFEGAPLTEGNEDGPVEGARLSVGGGDGAVDGAVDESVTGTISLLHEVLQIDKLSVSVSIEFAPASNVGPWTN